MAKQGEHGISWTEETWNPVRGCSRVSEGCRFCYAERVAARFSGPGQPYDELAKNTAAGPRWTGVVRLVPEHLDDPLRWKRPRRIFVNSMSDLFHEGLHFEEIAAVYGIMLAAPLHEFQVLTKRAERALAFSLWLRERGGLGRYIRSDEGRDALRGIVGNEHGTRTTTYRGQRVRSATDAWSMVMNAAACDMGTLGPSNVWLGVSVEDQATADERIPLLLQTPAAVRWVSYEPALGPVDFSPWVFSRRQVVSRLMNGPAAYNRDQAEHLAATPLDWIVCGGESGPGARLMHPAWARQVRDQCVAAGVAFHYKQAGEWEAMMPAADYREGVRGMGDSSEWRAMSEGVVVLWPSGRVEKPRSPYEDWWEGLDIDLLEAEDAMPWAMHRVGKKAAGRLLDGRTWDEFPEVAHA